MYVSSAPMSESSDAIGRVVLSPLELLPTEQLGSFFAPSSQPRPWQVRVPAPPSAAPVELKFDPPPVPVLAPTVAPAPPMATGSSMASISSSRPLTALRPDQVAVIHRIAATIAESNGTATRMGSFVSSVMGAMQAPKEITLPWLVEHHVTLRDLLTSSELRMSMTDLFSAGIVRTFDDLVRLGFHATDLTVNRVAFSCTHFVQLFGGDYGLLSKSERSGGFSVLTLLEANPPFTCGELQTLNVTAKDLILDDDGNALAGFRFTTLATMHLTPSDWAALGLDARHLLQYKVTPALVKNKMGWDPVDVARVFNLPESWLASR